MQIELTPVKAKTYPQGTLVWPIEPIKMGRINATPSQSFWVTNTTLSQQISGVIQIARSGRNSGSAFGISIADFEKYFSDHNTKGK